MPLLETDPVCLAVDPTTRDLVVPLRFLSGLEAVVQGARTRILLTKGEWFLDLDLGMPWFENDTVTEREAILGQRFNATRLVGLVKAAVLDTPGVVEVTKCGATYDGATRQVSISWEARVAWGDTATDVLVEQVGGGS